MTNKEITLNQYNIIGKKENVDLSILKNNIELESILIKNFNIDDKFVKIINTVPKLKKIWFVGCIFDNNIPIKNIEYLKLENCKNINIQIINSSLKELYIIGCKKVDINNIKNKQLTTLCLENEVVKNLSQIEEFINIENLYLQEINLNQEINFEKLTKLKRANFNGSKIENKELFLKQFKDKDIEINFLENNLKIE